MDSAILSRAKRKAGKSMNLVLLRVVVTWESDVRQLDARGQTEQHKRGNSVSTPSTECSQFTPCRAVSDAYQWQKVLQSRSLSSLISCEPGCG